MSGASVLITPSKQQRGNSITSQRSKGLSQLDYEVDLYPWTFLWLV